MSIHKFASNVIERCLHFGTKPEKNQLIDEILEKDEKMYNSLIALVKDKFGNYVVQKMIEYSDEDKRNQIVNKILESKILQINDGYTKHVLLYIQKLGYNINPILDNSYNSKFNNNVENVNNVDNNEIINNNNKSKIKTNQINIGNNNINLNAENENIYLNKKTESYMNDKNLNINNNKNKFN